MTTTKDLVNITKQYKEFFKASGIDMKVMPLNNSNKNPKYPHKGGVYDDMAHVMKDATWIDKDRKLCNYGWMLNDKVFCIDLDGFSDNPDSIVKDAEKKQSAEEYYKLMCDEFPDDINRAIIEKTRKGYHLIWKRTDKLAGLTDATDAFRHNDMKGIDIKTITNSRHNGLLTEAMLAVYPSNGKQWMEGHNPLEGALLQECSDELASWILKNMSKPEKAKPVKAKPVKVQVKSKGNADVEELKRLLPLLGPEFYELVSDGGDWELWMKVCRGIINICGPTGEAYDLFVQHCSRASSWCDDSEEKNKRYWDKYSTDESVENPIGIGSFRSWTKTAPPDGNFLDVLETFEMEHAKIVNKSVFLKFLPNEQHMFFSAAELKTSYENMSYTNSKGEEVPFIKKWLTYKNMRQYEDVVNEPPGIPYPSNCVNLWAPFAQERVQNWKHEEEGLQFILNHIKILCNHETEVYNYKINWIGQMIQFPGVKSTCITIISQQGAGKGSFLDLVRHLLGDSRVFKTSFPSRDCWGMFNGQMANAFFVNLDELSKTETLGAEGQIKTLVTDDTLTINKKGKGQYTMKSYHRFLITTNNEDPIKTSEDDRRNLIIRASDELCPSKMGVLESAKYFEKLREYLANPDVVKTVYEYFKSLPGLDKFNRIPIPSTEHQRNLKKLSKTPIECWLEDFVSRAQEDEVKIASADLYTDFCSWNSQYNKEYKVPNLQAFGVRLSNLKMPEIQTKLSSKCSLKVFNIAELRLKFGMIDINEAQI